MSSYAHRQRTDETFRYRIVDVITAIVQISSILKTVKLTETIHNIFGIKVSALFIRIHKFGTGMSQAAQVFRAYQFFIDIHINDDYGVFLSEED